MGPSAATRFARELNGVLQERFTGHWYADNPVKGQAYRTILYDPDYAVVDGALEQAATRAGIDALHGVLAKALENGLRMWIDPAEVMVENVRGKRMRKVLYKSATSPRPVASEAARSFSQRGLYTAEDHRSEKMKASVGASFVPSHGAMHAPPGLMMMMRPPSPPMMHAEELMYRGVPTSGRCDPTYQHMAARVNGRSDQLVY